MPHSKSLPSYSEHRRTLLRMMGMARKGLSPMTVTWIKAIQAEEQARRPIRALLQRSSRET
jgi:hypothetical protein